MTTTFGSVTTVAARSFSDTWAEGPDPSISQVGDGRRPRRRRGAHRQRVHPLSVLPKRATEADCVNSRKTSVTRCSFLRIAGTAVNRCISLQNRTEALSFWTTRGLCGLFMVAIAGSDLVLARRDPHVPPCSRVGPTFRCRCHPDYTSLMTSTKASNCARRSSRSRDARQ